MNTFLHLYQHVLSGYCLVGVCFCLLFNWPLQIWSRYFVCCSIDSYKSGPNILFVVQLTLTNLDPIFCLLFNWLLQIWAQYFVSCSIDSYKSSPNILKLCNLLVQFRLAISKTKPDIYCKNLGVRIALGVIH